MKRLLASAAATVLALGGLLVATAAPASAHSGEPVADCQSLKVDLWAYASGNGLTVVVDGKTLEPRNFDGRFSKTYQLDPTVAHTWSVAVDASDHDRYDAAWEGTTKPCQPADAPVQVGVYVYPKLDPKSPAAWENSGPQKLVTSDELALPEKPWDKTWLVAPLDLEEVRAVARTIVPDVTTEDLCTAWAVQQDLVDLPGGLDELPTDIRYSPDGKHLGEFPDGTLISWDHQDLANLFPEGACDTPGPVDEEVVAPATPEVPAAVEVCGTELTGENVPAESEQFRYTATAEGVVAEPKNATVEFSEETAQLGYVVAEDGRSALFPVADLLPAEEACALVPGAIEAVCQGDVPYLGYDVALPEGVTVDEENPLTITFLHPNGGEDHVVTGQPLSGTLLWPGASAAEPQQWPGFVRNEDGSYTETEGNFAWTRDGVEVLFEVNPSYSTVVTYPPATSACANPPVAPVAVENVAGPAEPGGPALATTGATVAGAAAFAALLVGGGVLVFWLRRRVQS
ncbi:hypothetical protein JOE63_000295 [Cellulosimicrobium cellulans]|uniref:hypothetical protein n=1 Tax=Cellulosimicrobium cellulans TaxID=1710 RepID=UPI001956BA8A|nr:hypothetical protein [Cellulosimicrobium cellulans]MBM7817818.1 hypothetical protein [Cellulosimicrobium cellulans]